jgi:hypothetical protein
MILKSPRGILVEITGMRARGFFAHSPGKRRGAFKNWLTFHTLPYKIDTVVLGEKAGMKK